MVKWTISFDHIMDLKVRTLITNWVLKFEVLLKEKIAKKLALVIASLNWLTIPDKIYFLETFTLVCDHIKRVFISSPMIWVFITFNTKTTHS